MNLSAEDNELQKRHDKVIDDNVMLAGLMGYKKVFGSWHIPGHERLRAIPYSHESEGSCLFDDGELEFHSSWDWLIPVIVELGMHVGDITDINKMYSIVVAEAKNIKSYAIDDKIIADILIASTDLIRLWADDGHAMDGDEVDDYFELIRLIVTYNQGNMNGDEFQKDLKLHKKTIRYLYTIRRDGGKK